MNLFVRSKCKSFFHGYHSSVGVYGFKPQSACKKLIASENALTNRKNNNQLFQLSEAFKQYGYQAAELNPLNPQSFKKIPELQLAYYDLDLNNTMMTNLDGILNIQKSEDTLENTVKHLQRIYCDKIGVEFSYLENEEKEWFARKFEQIQTELNFTNDEKKLICQNLLQSQVFDNFLATKFQSVKRYGAEGAESMISFFSEIFKQSSLCGLKDVVIGIPHRGRLNLLVGLLKYPPVALFNKMLGFPEFPSETDSTCDVISHLTSSVNHKYENHSVHVELLPNPSHLEAVSPVVIGYARSRLQSLKAADYIDTSEEFSYPVLPIQVHGDASFSGQGVVMETIALSKVPNFRVGGSIHLIVNNQVGFTTPQERGSSSTYCSDIMKMISAPVIHVNGDFPEEVMKAALLAFSYQQTFQKDVLVDMLCFRRWGHNELDDPMFTNPLMYKKIHSRKSVPNLYAQKLIADGLLSSEECTAMSSDFHSFLNENLKQAESFKPQLKSNINSEMKGTVSVYDTGVPINTLKFIGTKSVLLPENFHIHPTLKKNFVEERKRKLSNDDSIDWATAEALSIGSVLYQGKNVRLSGQDVGRGTFSHRHAMLIDQSNGEMFVPLNHMFEGQTGFYEVANSTLSEEGVLGFEYGFSIENQHNLVIWEAQFGDFFNSAQVVFDTLISSGEKKWLLPSRMVILLPHGYDGAGPEHSSCRMERFLQMSDSHESQVDSDDVNWHIVNPTTPAQYFHLLRHQVISHIPRPLIVVAPKILLRHPEAVSSLSDLQPGCHFQSVLDTNVPDLKTVKKLIFCSGKHYYFLEKERASRKIEDSVIVRIEKLCPFPAENIYKILQKYKYAKSIIWSQEEHRNMGAWTYIQPRFQNLFNVSLQYAGRKPLAPVAVGCSKYHQEEIKQIINDTFA